MTENLQKEVQEGNIRRRLFQEGEEKKQEEAVEKGEAFDRVVDLPLAFDYNLPPNIEEKLLSPPKN